ncbi:MAG: recombination mediator RecR [Pseudomonadota bacterium]
MSHPELDVLIRAMSRLPGLGPRSARRAVIHLLKHRDTQLGPLIEAMTRVSSALSPCPICHNMDTRSPCSICTDPRRNLRQLCVVEDIADLWALERAQNFRGKFHVLGGTLSAMDGVQPDDLNISTLVGRVRKGETDEVIIALSATVEGQTTAHYVADQLAGFDVSVTGLAHGVPLGGELDYLDDGTLTQAMKARRPLNERT